MLPGNSFAVQDFLPQRFRPGRPARSPLLAAAWLAPAAAAAGEACPSLRERHQTSLLGVAARRPKMPESVGLHSEAFCARGRRRTCTQKIQFGFPSFPVAFWGVLLQLPLAIAATSRGLNHPTASVPNKTKVSNSTDTPLFREPI